MHGTDGKTGAQYLLSPGGLQLLGRQAQLLGNARDVGRRAVLQQHGKLVTAHARQAIGFAKIGLQHARDFTQHLITGGMAAGFVDELELVQVDVEKSVGLDLVQTLGQHFLQPSLEFPAIFQPRQRVVACIPGDLVHVLLLARHIAQHEDRP